MSRNDVFWQHSNHFGERRQFTLAGRTHPNGREGKAARDTRIITLEYARSSRTSDLGISGCGGGSYAWVGLYVNIDRPPQKTRDAGNAGETLGAGGGLIGMGACWLVL